MMQHLVYELEYTPMNTKSIWVQILKEIVLSATVGLLSNIYIYETESCMQGFFQHYTTITPKNNSVKGRKIEVHSMV